MSDSRIVTYTGKYINPWKLSYSDICIEDIAHALSNLCRYGGHSRHFYSVAQHSVILAEECLRRWTAQEAYYALLHDAEEAYIIDLPRPIKDQFDDYHDLCQLVSNAINDRFWFMCPTYKEIQKLDKEMVYHEAHALMAIHPEWAKTEELSVKPTFQPVLEFMTPHRAEWMFLDMFGRLVSQLGKLKLATGG